MKAVKTFAGITKAQTKDQAENKPLEAAAAVPDPTDATQEDTSGEEMEMAGEQFLLDRDNADSK